MQRVGLPERLRRRRRPSSGRDYVLIAADQAQAREEPFSDVFLAMVQHAILADDLADPTVMAAEMARRPLREDEASPFASVCRAVETALARRDTQGAIEAAIFGAAVLEKWSDSRDEDRATNLRNADQQPMNAENSLHEAILAESSTVDLVGLEASGHSADSNSFALPAAADTYSELP